MKHRRKHKTRWAWVWFGLFVAAVLYNKLDRMNDGSTINNLRETVGGHEWQLNIDREYIQAMARHSRPTCQHCWHCREIRDARCIIGYDCTCCWCRSEKVLTDKPGGAMMGYGSERSGHGPFVAPWFDSSDGP